LAVKAMACPHCGEHLLHKRDGELVCCRCGRPRTDLDASPLLSLLRNHGVAILAGLLCLPLAFGMALLDGTGPTGAEAGAEAEVR
jgi:hypothetical protein